ncbi:hypothetical protein V8G54_033707 [Vigna mungo]|uniref:MI domain-containing protein n=1 Tax=Vigna mungo TaxID=3915 RepID=A0AAQ3MQA1_VIGMU
MARGRSSSSESTNLRMTERDRYRRGGRSGRKSSGHRRGNSDGSNSGEERNGAERDGRMGSDKKSRSRERKEKSESSEEEGQIVNKKRVSEEKGEDERLAQDYDRRWGRDAEGDSRGDSDSCRVNGQSERPGEKESPRLRHRDRWRGGEEDKSRIVDRRRRHDSEEDHIELTRKSDGYSDRDKRRKVEKGGNSDRDRHSRYDSEEDGRELARKPERDSDRKRRAERDDDRDRRRRAERDDDNERNHREKGVSKQQEESRKKENGNGRTVRDANPQRQTTIPGGNLNVEVFTFPFKMAMMMKEVQDKSSVEYQRLTWDALRKSINELMASPGFTDVFAALVAVVNTKFPQVGDLLLRRIVLQLKRAYKRNDKPQLLAAVKFIGHLVNQQVAHEIIALELLTVLLEKPTDDSVEVADLSPKGLHGEYSLKLYGNCVLRLPHLQMRRRLESRVLRFQLHEIVLEIEAGGIKETSIFERFRGILHEGEIDKRVQFLIEGLFAIRKAKFQGYPAVRPELDLVEQEDQLTHEVSLDEEIDPEISLDIFKPDPNFLENEKRYEDLKKSMLGEESEDEEEGMDAESDDEDEEDESDEEDEEQMQIKDETETNLVNLRRTIYLTIMSSVDFEEAGHKLLKIKLEPGQEMELCIMLLECCSQERTYLRYYGLLGQRFCMINKVHQENFEKCFVQQYSMIHRLETNKLRNVAKLFAHLLGTDALPWHVLSYIRLTEEDTTSSRIFIKILFQELSEHLGIRLLNERLNDPSMQESFESIFPKDNPKNTNLREYLKNMPRLIMQQQKQVSESESDDESGSSASSDSGTASSDSDSTSSDESDAEHDRRQRKRRRK